MPLVKQNVISSVYTSPGVPHCVIFYPNEAMNYTRAGPGRGGNKSQSSDIDSFYPCAVDPAPLALYSNPPNSGEVLGLVWMRSWFLSGFVSIDFV